jgi:hypothetical protein
MRTQFGLVHAGVSARPALNWSRVKRVLVSGVILGATVVGAPMTRPAEAGIRTLVVPTMYPTVQTAVDAAGAGDRIKVLPGTYREQVSIDKSLTITGSGAGSTTIQAPAALVAGRGGSNSIVEIHSGAVVAMSLLSVSGPGSGTCDNGALRNGIHVVEGELDLSFAKVTHIHDTPLAQCFRSGTGILVGDDETGSTGSVTVRFSEISDYQSAGIVVVNEGSTGTISHNVVTGQGLSTQTATDGIEFALGAVGTVSYNIVSGNACGSPELGCGTDFFEEFQHAGIGGGGKGTIITRNLLFDNQVGIYMGESAAISNNAVLNSHYFGIALQDGAFTVSHDRIVGEAGAIAAIASSVDTTVTLERVRIAGGSGAPVQEFECCGFTATTTGGP